MAKRKDRRKRWAAIIAAILSLAMALSAIAVFWGYLMDRSNAATPGGEVDPEVYREYFLGEVERLQNYIDEYGPTVPVLNELVQAYSLLIQLEDGEDAAAEERKKSYQENLKKYSLELVELEPDEPEYRLQLLYVYEQLDEEEAVIFEEVAALRELLHEKPDPSSSLMLIRFLKSSQLQEEIMDEEIAWLREHFEDLDKSGKMSSENRYYYAYLLAEYLEEQQAAEEQLFLIMEEESEDSIYYSAAKEYLEELRKKGKNSSSKKEDEEE